LHTSLKLLHLVDTLTFSLGQSVQKGSKSSALGNTLSPQVKEKWPVVSLCLIVRSWGCVPRRHICASLSLPPVVEEGGKKWKSSRGRRRTNGKNVELATCELDIARPMTLASLLA